jgi:hypothetical protein
MSDCMVCLDTNKGRQCLIVVMGNTWQSNAPPFVKLFAIEQASKTG